MQISPAPNESIVVYTPLGSVYVKWDDMNKKLVIGVYCANGNHVQTTTDVNDAIAEMEVKERT